MNNVNEVIKQISKNIRSKNTETRSATDAQGKGLLLIQRKGKEKKKKKQGQYLPHLKERPYDLRVGIWFCALLRTILDKFTNKILRSS